jgi:UDP-3-O-[3-hydroxymyristoyl] glucosamine N-acyltransferase
MRQSLARFSGPESSPQIRSLADFIATTSGFSFSVHTALDEAGPMHLTFFDNLKYVDQLASTKAGACLVSQRFEADPLA